MSAYGAIDLSKLQAPDAVEPLDFEGIVASYKALLTDGDAATGIVGDPSLAPALALESEPLTKQVEAGAYRELLIRNRVNAGVRAALLAYATGADLDNAAANLGVGRLEGEDDDRLRARAVLAPEGWSCAGPVGAYVYHALSASLAVADVVPSSPAPGQVRLAILSTAEDGVAAPDLLSLVFGAVNAEDVRPLTDQVSVVSATVTAYDVVASFTVLPGPDASTVEAAQIAAVQVYAADQRKLGKPIRRNALIACLNQPGVDALALLSPAADITAMAETAPVLRTLTVTRVDIL